MKSLLYLIIASTSFAFFILCPRMVGMAAVVANIKNVNPYAIVLVGAVLAIPLFGLMFFILDKLGVTWAIVVAVITDVLAALLMGIFSWKSTLQIIIIAVFLWVGVVIANMVTKIL